MKEFQLMSQKWRDLFFIHWTCSRAEIQKTLPEGLYVDTFEGEAYLGLVPFKVCNPTWIPSFLEINVRTYVYNEKNEKGVWFYSLDANNKLAVQGGRLFHRLPYSFANIAVGQTDRQIDFFHQREGTDKTSFMSLSYEPPFQTAAPGTLEFFLLERYLLFTESKGKIYQGRVSHQPYTFSKGRIHFLQNSLFELEGLKTFTSPTSCLYSPGVDVRIFNLLNIEPKKYCVKSKKLAFSMECLKNSIKRSSVSSIGS